MLKKSDGFLHLSVRQLNFFGYIVRENSLERSVLEGKIEGARSRGQAIIYKGGGTEESRDMIAKLFLPMFLLYSKLQYPTN